MNIDVRTRGFSITAGLRSSVERRLEFALDRHRDRIAGIRVVLSDLNGPKGGDDKACRLDIRLRGGGTVRASAVDADAYAAIAVATHRGARAVARALQRERTTMLELLWLTRAVSRGSVA